ncbi:IS110 family transposase [Rhodococcus sp. SRB_17]|nr:IS110 family transposase [Rhodococcus sp. SRB_17]
MNRIFVGVDVGKEIHWACVLDRDGHVLLSRKLRNDEDDITLVLSEVASLGSPENTTWTVDLIAVEASLLLAILFDHHQSVQYLPGSAVNRASAGYRGEGKTDAKDARVIADQSRMRRDLTHLQPDETVVREMRMLITRRNDVVADRIRTISQLRQQLTAVCPALERVSKIAEHHGWVILLSRYQRPKAVRRAGVSRLTSLLTSQGLRPTTAAKIATAAVDAAKTQSVHLPAEELAAELVADLARDVLRLNALLVELDAKIESRFRQHPLAEIVISMPGMGPRLGAEFLSAIGTIEAFASPDRLASYAGLAPVPRDSGKTTGRHHRPYRYNRQLRRVMYLSALHSIRFCPESKTYFEKKKAEGKHGNAAVMALARRRTNVLWALIRDHRVWSPAPPHAVGSAGQSNAGAA